MLDTLPVEIVQQIAGHLPTAQSITSLLATDRDLRKQYTVDPHALFRSFVQNTFPTANPPPLWRDAACALTSRVRAWDRKALSVRHVVPPRPSNLFDGLTDRTLIRQASLCGPIVDSYSEWLGPSWSDGREVLVWSLFGRVLLRVSDGKQQKLSAYSSPSDHLAGSDISDLRLLRADQRPLSTQECFVFGRADGRMGLVSYDTSTNEFEERRSFQPLKDRNRDVYRFDVSLADEPLVARLYHDQIDVFPITSADNIINPINTYKPGSKENTNKLAARAIKFVSPSVVACSLRDQTGPRPRSIIHIHNLAPAGFIENPLVHLGTAAMDDKPSTFARCFANLPSSSGSHTASGSNLLLSGWTDSTVLLHDLRTTSVVMKFEDHVDARQVSSVLAIDDKRFLAASDEYPCLRAYDIRMPRYGTPNSTFDLSNGLGLRPQTPHVDVPEEDPRGSSYLLSVPVPRSRTLTPHHTALDAFSPSSLIDRYKGPIFSLSTPSSYSSTVYAGIELGVLKLDFHNTDDILSNSEHSVTTTSALKTGGKRVRKFWDVLPTPENYGLELRPVEVPSQSLLKSTVEHPASHGSNDTSHYVQHFVRTNPMLFPQPIAVYLRPRAIYLSTDPIHLRKQLHWTTTAQIWLKELEVSQDRRNNEQTQEHSSTYMTATEAVVRKPSPSPPSRNDTSNPSGPNEPPIHRREQHRVRAYDSEQELWDFRWRLAGDKDLPDEFGISTANSRRIPVRARGNRGNAAASSATVTGTADTGTVGLTTPVAGVRGARGQGRGWERGRGGARSRGTGGERGRGGWRGGERRRGTGAAREAGRGRGGDGSASGPSRGRGEG